MTEYWVSRGNKWCDFCKIYLSNNPSSIRNHELGQCHKDNVVKRLAAMRKENATKEKEQKETAHALEQIEAHYSNRGVRVNTGRDNNGMAAAAEAIQRMADVIVQQNQKAAQQQEATAETQNLLEYHRNNPPQFKGEFDLEKANIWIKELEKIF